MNSRGILQWRPQEGGGLSPETEKMVVEKWGYFPGLIKVTIP